MTLYSNTVTYRLHNGKIRGMTDPNDTTVTDTEQIEITDPIGQLTAEELIRVIHPVFDDQIINYGAYNLVYATGSATYRNPDIAALQEGAQEHFLVGYHDSPDEVIIAPIKLPDVSSAGAATTIDSTNALHAYHVGEHSVGLESINGSRFLLTLSDAPELVTHAGTGIIDQRLDVQDFRTFVTAVWPVL